MAEDLVIVGAGGFGREVADVVDAINAIETTWNLLGFLDDSPTDVGIAKIERRGSRVIGALDEAAGLPPGTRFVVAIGDPATRQAVVAHPALDVLEPGTLVHPTANIGAGTHIGKGTIVCGHSDIGSDVTIGEHVHVDRGVQIGHDSSIGSTTTLHPSAVVSGSCSVGTQSELGTNCTLLPGVQLSDAVRVGAAACVTRDVTSSRTVMGVPAR